VSDSFVVAAMVPLGVLSVLVGACVRAGGCRRALRYYFIPDMPAHLHNGAFVLIPIGAALILISAGVSIAQSAPPRVDPTAMSADFPFIGFGLVCLFTGVWWGVRPPGWIKPAWLRAEEQAIREGMPVPDRRERPFTPRAYALNWLGLLVGSAAWLAFGLPVGALLIGLSTGIALLVANRPTRT
jgi:hypothetical protein